MEAINKRNEINKESKKSRNRPPPPLVEAKNRPHSIVQEPGEKGQYTTYNGDGTSKSLSKSMSTRNGRLPAGMPLAMMTLV